MSFHTLIRKHPKKSECKFIQLDIKEFYHFITEKMLNNAITFAENYIAVSKEDIRIIKHCRKSLLFSENEAWKKKDTVTTFDVMMGSYDGPELRENIGIYIHIYIYIYIYIYIHIYTYIMSLNKYTFQR